MVIYPLLGGLIRLDVNPNGGFSAGVMLGSFGDDAIFFLFFPFFPLLSLTSFPFFYSGFYLDGWIEFRRGEVVGGEGVIGRRGKQDEVNNK